MDEFDRQMAQTKHIKELEKENQGLKYEVDRSVERKRFICR